MRCSHRSVGETEWGKKGAVTQRTESESSMCKNAENNLLIKSC